MGEQPDPADELMQGNALIRGSFGVNPAELEPEEWSRLLCEAVWLEGERLKNLAGVYWQRCGMGNSRT